MRTYINRVGIVEDDGQYGAFFAAIAARRAGQPDRAEAVLHLVAPAIAERSWTSEVLQFMVRQTDPTTFLARAKSVGERTEAHAYVGFALEEEGRNGEALEHFQWVVDHGAKNYLEYSLAKNEIARLRHSDLRQL
jgi:hypothetical protein